MTNKPENPRAFPLPVSDNNLGYEGMTLRDYFAAAALNGIVTRQTTFEDIELHLGLTEDCEWIAEKCYSLADAMLKARES